MGWRLFFTGRSGESSLMMEIYIYAGNLSKSTPQEDQNALFSRAGDVTSVNIINDNKSAESNGFAFVTMSAQNEAEQAVSMFKSCSQDDHYSKVILLRPRQQRGFDKT
jgi:RNA recognition motif-containing protein